MTASLIDRIAGTPALATTISALLAKVEAFIRRFMVLSADQIDRGSRR